MSDVAKSFDVYADERLIATYSRAILSGRDELDLYPTEYTLVLFNLSEDEYLNLSRCRKISVEKEGSILASGINVNVYRRIAPDGALIFVVFSQGIDLWEKPVSLSVDSESHVSGAVQAILAASGLDIALLSFSGEDPVVSRPQVFLGRAAECIEEALMFTTSRACLVASGLYIVPKDGFPESILIQDEDLICDPEFTSDGKMILRTIAVGWTIGKEVKVSSLGLVTTGLISERYIYLDTGSGPWKAELLIEVAK